MANRSNLKRLVIVLSAVAGIFVSYVATSADARSFITQTIARSADACPPPFNTGGYTCTFQPATVTTKSHTKIVVKKSVKEQIKQYETAHNIIVSVNMGAPMSGAGCINPAKVKSWGFHVGDTFKNTDKYHSLFPDKWQTGRMVCKWHLQKIGGIWYVIGTKDNCRNAGIQIPVRHKLPKPTKRVVVFTSVKTFQSTYERLATSTSSTNYTCNAGWTLTYTNGVAWCFIATQIPTPTPTTTTVVTVTNTTTTTATTTTTPPTTTTPAPKPQTDLCQNIPGEQTAVPTGYKKDPPDAGVSGNCYYVGP